MRRESGGSHLQSPYKKPVVRPPASQETRLSTHTAFVVEVMMPLTLWQKWKGHALVDAHVMLKLMWMPAIHKSFANVQAGRQVVALREDDIAEESQQPAANDVKLSTQ